MKIKMKMVAPAGLFLIFVSTVLAEASPENTFASNNSIIATNLDSLNRIETVSGILLYQDKRSGNFLLRFNQKLKTDGNLELKNQKGKVLFTQPLASGQSYAAHPMPVGNLPSGTYLIEVKTPDTTYWKKVRIRR